MVVLRCLGADTLDEMVARVSLYFRPPTPLEEPVGNATGSSKGVEPLWTPHVGDDLRGIPGLGGLPGGVRVAPFEQWRVGRVEQWW